jgi:hypothetical protein
MSNVPASPAVVPVGSCPEFEDPSPEVVSGAPDEVPVVELADTEVVVLDPGSVVVVLDPDSVAVLPSSWAAGGTLKHPVQSPRAHHHRWFKNSPRRVPLGSILPHHCTRRQNIQ